MTAFAGGLFAVLIAFAALFQIALGMGAPWGELANGGRFPGRLPASMRAVAFIQASVLLVLGIIILTHAGWVEPRWHFGEEDAVWLVVGFSALSVGLNLATPSRKERRLWDPIALGMLVSSTVVAISTR